MSEMPIDPKAHRPGPKCGTAFRLAYSSTGECVGSSKSVQSAMRAASGMARVHPKYPDGVEYPDVYSDEEWDHLANRPREGAWPVAWKSYWSGEWHQQKTRPQPWKRTSRRRVVVST